MMKKRIVSLLLAFVMTFSLLPTMAWAADNDCSAADDGSVTWPYDADTTTLTISDKGAMKDYANVSSTPWNAYKASVSVNQETVAVTGVSLNAEELNLTVGEYPVTLVATVEPENAADKTVTWTSSDPAVATVADGIVTPVAMGTTTITATTVDGSFTKDCKVTVWGSCQCNEAAMEKCQGENYGDKTGKQHNGYWELLVCRI